MIDTGNIVDISEWWRNGVGPGWQDICWRLHAELMAIDPGYNPVQVKEKFGGLRYYIDSTYEWDTPEWEAMNEAITVAEKESLKTCEDCGQPGELRSKNRYWIRTLCDACDAPYLKNKSEIGYK